MQIYNMCWWNWIAQLTPSKLNDRLQNLTSMPIKHTFLDWVVLIDWLIDWCLIFATKLCIKYWYKPYQTYITIRVKIVICKMVVHKKRRKFNQDSDNEFTEQTVLSYFIVVYYNWSISEPAWMAPDTWLSFLEIFVQSVFWVGCDITKQSFGMSCWDSGYYWYM